MSVIDHLGVHRVTYKLSDGESAELPAFTSIEILSLTTEAGTKLQLGSEGHPFQIEANRRYTSPPVNDPQDPDFPFGRRLVNGGFVVNNTGSDNTVVIETTVGFIGDVNKAGGFNGESTLRNGNGDRYLGASSWGSTKPLLAAAQIRPMYPHGTSSAVVIGEIEKKTNFSDALLFNLSVSRPFVITRLYYSMQGLSGGRIKTDLRQNNVTNGKDLLTSYFLEGDTTLVEYPDYEMVDGGSTIDLILTDLDAASPTFSLCVKGEGYYVDGDEAVR